MSLNKLKFYGLSIFRNKIDSRGVPPLAVGFQTSPHSCDMLCFFLGVGRMMIKVSKHIENLAESPSLFVINLKLLLKVNKQICLKNYNFSLSFYNALYLFYFILFFKFSTIINIFAIISINIHGVKRY